MEVDRTWGSTLVKNHDENKTYILVKLSESFSNAIQEYSAPKIKFHGSRGAIKFQNGKSYDFSLERSDNTVECIRESKNKWETVGKMACCLHVKGKDDVYQRTRTKMEVAEKEKRKFCTKLLGSPEHHPQTQATPISQPQHHSQLQPQNQHHHHNNHHHNNYNNHHHNNNISHHPLPNSNSNNISNTNINSNANATVTDIKSSLLSSLSTGSATSSSSASSASSSSVAPATSGSSSSSNNLANLNKFPDITDSKQMIRYKAEFDEDFKEYQQLHGYLHRIEERFRKLKETLKRNVEGSNEWELAKEEIFNEYERLKGDSNFHKARAKYQQLYNKLDHIKKRIFQYKHEHRDKCNSRKKRKR